MSNAVNDIIFENLLDEFSDLITESDISESMKDKILLLIEQGDFEGAQYALSYVAKYALKGIPV